MSNKKFKIKPKVWPKEYTFEEFKQLNPNTSENLLINYYNKYLQEYAENRSRYIKHFNNTKNDLSKELKILKERVDSNPDGDQTVGPTGAGRKFKSPLKGNFHSVQFDHTDDYAYYHPNNDVVGGYLAATPPGQGTIRPTEQLTALVWLNGWDGDLLNGAFAAKVDNILGARDYNDGWDLIVNYRRLYFNIRTNAPGTGPHDGSVNLSAHIAANVMVNEEKVYYREQHPGWVCAVITFDGRYAKVYMQGLIAEGDGTNKTGHTDHIKDAGSDGHTICYMRSSNLATYNSASYFGGVGIGCTGRLRGNGTAGDPLRLNYAQSLFSGSIGEVAIWDKCLDADAIMDIYSGSMGPYENTYELNYAGYGTDVSPGYHSHPYDLDDLGISYKNVGKYANNLQAWWRMEEGTGATIKDYSGKNRDITLNGGTWDSTLGVSASASPGV